MNYGRVVVEQALRDLNLEMHGESASGWAKVFCPLHDNHDTPALLVHVVEGGWRCMAGCGKSDDLADLVSQATQRPYSTVRHELVNGAVSSADEILSGMLVDHEKYEPTREPLFYERGRVPKYMVNRGFTLETLKAWDIGWDSERNAVVFPVFEGEELVALIYRPIGDAWRGKYENTVGFVKNAHLFGGHMVTVDRESVVVVEGPTDAMAWWQAGYSAVALMGATMSDQQANRLASRFWSVGLGLDNDKAGQKGTMDAIKLLGGRVDLSVVSYPAGKKDAAACTPEELAEAWSSASAAWEVDL